GRRRALGGDFHREGAAQTRLLAEPDHQDPAEARRGVVRVTPLVDDPGRRAAAGRAEYDRHDKHEEPEWRERHDRSSLGDRVPPTESLTRPEHGIPLAAGGDATLTHRREPSPRGDP